MRKDEVLKIDNRLDSDLLWFLRTEASCRPRDELLPDVLKRKGTAWIRQNRKDISEREKHVMLSKALPNAMLDNGVDRNMRVMLRRQNPRQLEAFNLYVHGMVIPKRGLVNRMVYNLGFRRTADKCWLSTAYRVLPKKA